MFRSWTWWTLDVFPVCLWPVGHLCSGLWTPCWLCRSKRVSPRTCLFLQSSKRSNKLSLIPGFSSKTSTVLLPAYVDVRAAAWWRHFLFERGCSQQRLQVLHQVETHNTTRVSFGAAAGQNRVRSASQRSVVRFGAGSTDPEDRPKAGKFASSSDLRW